MSNDHPVLLPQAILSSNDFKALNTDQRKSFSARIAHCLEIAMTGEDACGQSDSEFFSAIDGIELDAFSIMSASSDAATTVSPYRVHSSWLFECDKQAMSSHVDKAAAEFLASSSFRFKSASTDLRSWLQSWAAMMQATQRRLTSSSSFTEAVAQLIVIDALVAAFLVFAASSRLNAYAR